MTQEERKKLAEKLRRRAKWYEKYDDKGWPRDLRAAADLIDPPTPAGTERFVVQVFRDGDFLFADGFSNDDDDERLSRVQKMMRDGATLAATIVADIPKAGPPVIDGTVVQ